MEGLSSYCWTVCCIASMRCVSCCKSSRKAADRLHHLGRRAHIEPTGTGRETLHHTLNILAETIPPDWLQAQITPEWFERYGQRFDNARLPKEQRACKEPALTVDVTHTCWIRFTLRRRRVCCQRNRPCGAFGCNNTICKGKCSIGVPKKQFNLPPAGLTIASPYDVEVRYSNKRGLTGHGYKAHLTETCDDQTPHLVTHVETTPVDVLDTRALSPHG